MTSTTYPPTGTANMATGVTSLDNFIPELWSDEIIAAFKSNLVIANLVSEIPHTGKKGDTIHIPTPTRGDAAKKAEATAVTIISNVESVTDLSINEHWEYTRLVEDLAALQSINSYRNFYTDDAGYSLASRTDREIFKDVHFLQGGAALARATVWEKAVIGSDGSTIFAGTGGGNSAKITDAGLRTIIQSLDDADVPSADRCLVIPPVEKNNLMSVPRFTEQAFVGEGGSANTIRNGLVGELYGVDIFVSTNCPFIWTNTALNTVVVNFSGTAPSSATYSDEYSDVIGDTLDMSSGTIAAHRGCFLGHKSALVHIPQQGVRTQTQYKQEYLSDLFTADVVFGHGELRDDAGFGIVVPS